MYAALRKCALFDGIDLNEADTVLSRLSGRTRRFNKGEFIFMAGASQPQIGVLLSGQAQILRENHIGDSMIVRALQEGELFGETYACMGIETIPVSVCATAPCEVLFLSTQAILGTCISNCAFHHRLIANLLRVLAQKNMLLNRKMSYITHKTIRERLLSYFYDCMEQSGSERFTVPFNRRELADYLCTDRSALSRELSAMQREGIIEYKGNLFRYKERN